MRLSLLVLLLLVRSAFAHQTSVKYIDVDPELGVTVRCAPSDLEGIAPEQQAAVVQGWFAVPGCTETTPAADVDGNFIRVRWQLRCEDSTQLHADFTKFFELDR